MPLMSNSAVMDDRLLARAGRGVDRAIERTNQPEERHLLVCAQRGKLRGDKILVGRDNLPEQLLAARSEKEAIGASFLAAFDKVSSLHPVKELAHVALGDEQRVGERLLGHPGGGSHVGEDVELSHAQSVEAHLLLGASKHLVVEASYSKPGKNARLACPSPCRRGHIGRRHISLSLLLN